MLCNIAFIFSSCWKCEFVGLRSVWAPVFLVRFEVSFCLTPMLQIGMRPQFRESMATYINIYHSVHSLQFNHVIFSVSSSRNYIFGSRFEEYVLIHSTPCLSWVILLEHVRFSYQNWYHWSIKTRWLGGYCTSSISQSNLQVWDRSCS